MEEKDLRIWCTYHDGSQIEQYGWRDYDTFQLFKGNDIQVEGENINSLNLFYAELCTLYWVWKNDVRSRKVGFCHYRRRFGRLLDIERGECQVLFFHNNFDVAKQYRASHNYQDYYDAIDILNEQYGEGNAYSLYLLEGRTFIPYCCFVMHWEDFERLCEFMFSVLFAFDKKNGLDMKPDRYMEKTVRDFRYDDVAYQCRAVSFLGERLVSCFMVNEMKVYYVCKA